MQLTYNHRCPAGPHQGERVPAEGGSADAALPAVHVVDRFALDQPGHPVDESLAVDLLAVERLVAEHVEGAARRSRAPDRSIFTDALHRIRVGDALILLTWLHLADRDVLQAHPTRDTNIPLKGVFRTRSPDRPNPIGVHTVAVTALEGPTSLHVAAPEAIDGAPILDLKIAMREAPDGWAEDSSRSVSNPVRARASSVTCRQPARLRR
jgi:tRNA-Thr(GGU) m(6)t(6)A37 methyltransferase TsaA